MTSLIIAIRINLQPPILPPKLEIITIMKIVKPVILVIEFIGECGKIREYLFAVDISMKYMICILRTCWLKNYCYYYRFRFWKE